MLLAAKIKARHHNASPVVAHDMLPKNSKMKMLLKESEFNRIKIIDKPCCYICLANNYRLKKA
jgi:hypothetical protein